ncbi:proteasome assembly chaperone family protein [Thermomonospora umbrina]|uniref:Putative ATP-grasp superfamily ATP-dependent carboligase n=1 Tax=Thermomonospora umbrina TaxID=111806 RepID=A0A3D9SN56_9ACTN|nr:PAC2 family protein [Thermomonospora umbrina]REE95383.1 putative ATP-grasp superfamily ATP-dependent carboligase [Thermomonospora umbrina]
MRNPEDLYELSGDLPEMTGPVLLYSLDGFVDAGSVGELVREHLLDSLDHRVVARFDVDSLIDYRARRPVMTYDRDHWESYDAPELVVHLVRDEAGSPFLFLTGPEPDRLWEGFAAAVRSLVERLGISLAISFHGIPMGVPHTRPVGLTAHATRPELVTRTSFFDRVQVPGSASALLEFRLGEAGHDALGYAVHVPHYLAQSAYPTAAVAALEAVIGATGLVLPSDALREAAARTEADIAQQVTGNDEVEKVVQALEQQYDAFAGATERESLLAEENDMPTADELGAEFERFLAERGGDTPPDAQL